MGESIKRNPLVDEVMFRFKYITSQYKFGTGSIWGNIEQIKQNNEVFSYVFNYGPYKGIDVRGLVAFKGHFTPSGYGQRPERWDEMKQVIYEGMNDYREFIKSLQQDELSKIDFVYGVTHPQMVPILLKHMGFFTAYRDPKKIKTMMYYQPDSTVVVYSPKNYLVHKFKEF